MADNLVVASEQEIQEYFDAAVKIAKEAGQVVQEAFHKDKVVDTKSCGTDLVTETDEYVEKLIIGTLKEKFPSHSFIGEETVSSGGKCNLTNNPTWIIDPIDGTTNFVHRYPMVSVSIALAINKQVEVGVVYSCIRDEMYSAKRGCGAFCNEKQIHCSGVTDLSKAIVITEVGSSREPERMTNVMNNFRKLAEEPIAVHSIRLQGSAAINLCSVACGSAELYYEFGIHCWDIAAGALIVEEAGGLVRDPSGKPLDIMARCVLGAATKELCEEICRHLECIDLPRD